MIEVTVVVLMFIGIGLAMHLDVSPKVNTPRSSDTDSPG